MSKVIYKYQFTSLHGVQEIMVPEGAKILKFGPQHNTPTLWVVIDPTKPSMVWRFRLYHTGETLDENPGQYIDSAIFFADDYVLHCYWMPT